MLAGADRSRAPRRGRRCRGQSGSLRSSGSSSRRRPGRRGSRFTRRSGQPFSSGPSARRSHATPTRFGPTEIVAEPCSCPCRSSDELLAFARSLRARAPARAGARAGCRSDGLRQAGDAHPRRRDRDPGLTGRASGLGKLRLRALLAADARRRRRRAAVHERIGLRMPRDEGAVPRGRICSSSRRSPSGSAHPPAGSSVGRSCAPEWSRRRSTSPIAETAGPRPFRRVACSGATATASGLGPASSGSASRTTPGGSSTLSGSGFGRCTRRRATGSSLGSTCSRCPGSSRRDPTVPGHPALAVPRRRERCRRSSRRSIAVLGSSGWSRASSRCAIRRRRRRARSATPPGRPLRAWRSSRPGTRTTWARATRGRGAPRRAGRGPPRAP